MLDLLSIVVAPAALWLVYHYYKDRVRPEPLVPILASYAAGFASGWACLQAFGGLNALGLQADPEGGAAAFAVYCLVVVGPLEELAKLAPFLLLCVRLRHFDEPVDGIIYASAVALGFASFENVEYMRFLDGVEMLARAVASPLTHCMFASIWGYAVGRAVHDGKPITRPLVIAFALSATAHGFYDFVVVRAHPFLRPLTAGIILAIWIWRMRTIRGLQREQTDGDA